MYHADLSTIFVRLMAGNIPIIWGIHHTIGKGNNLKLSTLLVVRINSWLSRYVPTRIVCVSNSAYYTHKEIGFDISKMVIIPNGFDLKTFAPDLEAKTSIRKELALPIDTVLIGCFARFHPQKDHKTFIQAAKLLLLKNPQIHFLLAGNQINDSNPILVRWIKNTGFKENFHLLGLRHDMPRLTACLDIATSSASADEAFPLIIGEAMACGVPCVATDVGDIKSVIENTGIIVPPKSPEELAGAWEKLLALPENVRGVLGVAARDRITHLFSIDYITDTYIKMYEEILGKK
jgi:glycosyltransferase involved in cell wall biosynthesis